MNLNRLMAVPRSVTALRATRRTGDSTTRATDDPSAPMREKRRRGRRRTGLGALALAVASLTGALVVPGFAPQPAAADTPPLPIVPQPELVTAAAGDPFTLTANTSINVLSTEADPVGVGKYLAGLLAPSTGYSLPVVSSTEAQNQAIVLNPGGPDSLGDEGYKLASGSGGVTVTAHGAKGLFRGVQTLRQLLPAAVESRTEKDGPWTVAPVQISDKPRYGYRGVMLDVARRFFPVDDVKRYIDQAAAYKINTLHMHLTNDQGWRSAIEAYPDLTKVGASTQVGHTGGTNWYYTAEQYKEIVAYAKSRFMTVVPEISGPGHSNAAMASVPNLNCNDRAATVHTGPTFPAAGRSIYCLDEKHVPNVTAFLKTVISTVAKLTPDSPYIHLGGDEVPDGTPPTWFQAYVSAAAKAVTDEKKTVMGWHELGQATIPSGSVMQYWGLDGDRNNVGTANESKNIKAVRKAVEQGARFVMSPNDHAYLDMKYDFSTPYGQDWLSVPLGWAYGWDPETITAKPDDTGSVVPADKIEGVEAALWTDKPYVKSSSDITSTNETDRFPAPSVYADYMSFPRLPAIAEIGWSPKTTHNWASFKTRLGAHGPRWTAGGFGYYADPVVPWKNHEGSLNGIQTIVTGGKALDVPAGSTDIETQINTWTLHGGDNQKWHFNEQADGSYTIVNRKSGLCLDVKSGSTSAGGAVIQWTCTTNTNQRWNVTSASGGYTIKSVKSGLLLTTASTTDGALVTQQTDTNSALQLWTIG